MSPLEGSKWTPNIDKSNINNNKQKNDVVVVVNEIKNKIAGDYLVQNDQMAAHKGALDKNNCQNDGCLP